MDYDVHRIRADEWPQYRELRLEALQDSPLAFVEQYDESLAQPDRFWQDRVDRGAAGATSSLFVAVHGDTFVGKASCFVEPDITDFKSVHVVGVYVTPRFRGTGVAEAVVSAAIRFAQDDAGADRVRLFVTENNERAAAFYRRLGFAPTGVTMPYPPDPTYAEHEMVYKGDR